MIDACDEEEDESERSSEVKMLSGDSPQTLQDADIVANAITFMLAGYETTSNTLAYTSYLLALNQDKQDKLCDMIDAYYEEHEVCVFVSIAS